jgi:phi13 family phage major tail protein
MATIGMDKLFYAPITEDENGYETFGVPVSMAKAISGDLTVDLVEANLFADDGLAIVIKDFRSGTLVIGTDDLKREVVMALTGASVDENGVLIATSEDIGKPVAIGFRAQKPGGKYRYFWFYRVQFGFPGTTLQTKGDTITFQTPSISGTVLRRNKPDGRDKHPWKAEVTEGDAEVPQSVFDEWYDSVYEPEFTETMPEGVDPGGGEEPSGGGGEEPDGGGGEESGGEEEPDGDDPTITAGNQEGTLTEPDLGTVTFALLSAGIADGTFTTDLSGEPANITAEAVTITDNEGLLTINKTGEVIAGVYSIDVTIGGAAVTIELVISEQP